MRFLVVLLVGLLLSGCAYNRVMSEAQLFGPREFAEGPSLKPGLWRQRHCVPKRDSDVLPECSAIVVGADGRATIEGQAVSVVELDGPATRMDIAGGDPLIFPLLWAVEDKPSRYLYFGAKAKAWDEMGRLTALQIWEVECGPPPSRAYNKRTGSFVTQYPSPGLVIQDDNCLASSANVVRRAAKDTYKRVRRSAMILEWYAEAPSVPPEPEPADRRR